MNFRNIAENASKALQQGDIKVFGDMMLHDLDAERRAIDQDTWVKEVIPFLRQQPFYRISNEDPFSRRSVLKPRKYAGDAVLIDYLYRNESIAEYVRTATPIGQAIYNYWTTSPAAKAVRDRKELFTRALIDLALRRHEASVFVLAGGHFREAEQIIGTKCCGRLQITYLDQDEESCEAVRRAGTAKEIICKNVTAILRMDRKFDLIYAAGLYDYLSDSVAARLNRKLISMLNPSGCLVVPNFLDMAPNRASMELLQDWFLIYRTKDEILKTITNAAPPEDAHLHYETDPNNTVGYAFLELRE